MLFPLFFVPLIFAWMDWFKLSGHDGWRKKLSVIGLTLLSIVPILSVIALMQVNKARGISPDVLHTERWMFATALASIPFLLFGYRMTRWLGITSALFLPFLTSFVDSLY